MKTATLSAFAALAGLWLWRQQSRDRRHRTQPGRAAALDTWLLAWGAGLFQDHAPLRALNLYLDGFHFHSGDLGRQVEAHHFCAPLGEELIQCVIFDGTDDKARLIGVEYIISERLFDLLPDDEKRLWHSHRYEVRSGTLVAPGIPRRLEHRLMEKLASTYGKTWHTWDAEHDLLPLGIPSLMMGMTGDGQLDPRLLVRRDRRLSIDTKERRHERADIHGGPPLPGADAWAAGRTPQLGLEEQALRGGPSGPRSTR